MALTTASDITVVLSGGTINIDPNRSLGGDPSNSPIIDGILNNLFDDVSPEESESGHEDYRCIYFFNDGTTPVYSVKVFIVEDFEKGATIEVGIQQRNEIQRIQVTGSLAGGQITLSYEGVEFTSNFNADLGTWATTLETTLNSLVDGSGDPLLREVTVNAQATDSQTKIFDISFVGIDGSRNHSEFILVSNNLVSGEVTGSTEVEISTPQEGAPVNTIAPEISLETTPPGGVVFFAASELSPISIPYLKAEEGFPVWVKRTIAANTDAVAEDGVKLRFVGEALAP